MSLQFKPATKEQSKLRLALVGPSGSGKTWTALLLAKELGQKVAVIDTEHGSASKYADDFSFDVLQLTSYSPERYSEAIKAAASAGYDVLVIDSMSHAWQGKDGALELVDRASSRAGENSFTAWRHVTPLHNQLVEDILASPLHIIGTMRTKTEWIVEKDERGRSVPRKIGLAPIQRQGIEFEFDITGDLDVDHTLVISKTRCAALDGAVIRKPGKDMAETLKLWLTSGAPVEYANEAQVDRIAELVAAAADNDTAKAEALVAKVKAEYGVDAIGRLRASQADEAISRLHDVIEKQLARQVDQAANALQTELGANEVAA